MDNKKNKKKKRKKDSLSYTTFFDCFGNATSNTRHKPDQEQYNPPLDVEPSMLLPQQQQFCVHHESAVFPSIQNATK